jgi:cytochrome c5
MFKNRHLQAERRSSRNGIPKRSTMAIVLLLLLPVAHAQPKADQRSGKDVVETVCAACHAKGEGGAPRIGDSKAWSKRASQGLTSLTGAALKGIRGMPPHGGSPGLTDLEIQRAVTYMVNQSGGRWKEPIDKSVPPTQRSAEQIVRTQCAKCHESGAGGAPRIGDRAAWIPRMKPGFETVVRSAINGHGGMPARGGMADLTDPEVRSAITYMFNPPATPAK